MNSVIQQLYMIPPIRNGILAIEGTGTDVDDDMSGDEKQENEVKTAPWSRSSGSWLIIKRRFPSRPFSRVRSGSSEQRGSPG